MTGFLLKKGPADQPFDKNIDHPPPDHAARCCEPPSLKCDAEATGDIVRHQPGHQRAQKAEEKLSQSRSCSPRRSIQARPKDDHRSPMA